FPFQLNTVVRQLVTPTSHDDEALLHLLRCFDRFEHCSGLVSTLHVLEFGDAIVDDTAGRLRIGDAVLHYDRADGESRIEVAGEVEVADRAAIWPTAVGLQIGDDLHRPDL